MTATAPLYARPGRGAPRTPLRLVPAPTRRPARAPFVLLVGGLLLAGLVTLLMLNTLSAQDAFTLQTLQRRTAALAEQQQALQLAVAQQSTPAALAARAVALGMDPGGPASFVRLRDGRLAGVVTAVPPPPPPAPVTTTVAPRRAAPTTAKHGRTAAKPKRR